MIGRIVEDCNLIKDKGIETLFSAFKKVSAVNKNINLLIAGDIDVSNPSAISKNYIDHYYKDYGFGSSHFYDKDKYQKQLEDLVSQFQENFKKYDVNQEIVSAGPGFDG